jgi:hypothetical protein
MKPVINSFVVSNGNPKIEVGGASLVEVNLLELKGELPLYWRVGDGRKSLLEFAISPRSGALLGVSLVIINPDLIFVSEASLIKPIDAAPELPVFDLKIWGADIDSSYSHRFLDGFDCAVRVFLFNSSILIDIDNAGGMPEKWVSCGGDFYVGLNDDCCITHLLLDDLSGVELREFIDQVA